MFLRHMEQARRRGLLARAYVLIQNLSFAQQPPAGDAYSGTDRNNPEYGRVVLLIEELSQPGR